MLYPCRSQFRLADRTSQGGFVMDAAGNVTGLMWSAGKVRFTSVRCLTSSTSISRDGFCVISRILQNSLSQSGYRSESGRSTFRPGPSSQTQDSDGIQDDSLGDSRFTGMSLRLLQNSPQLVSRLLQCFRSSSALTYQSLRR